MLRSPAVHLRFPSVSSHGTRLTPPTDAVMPAERTLVSIVEGPRRSLPLADHARGKRLAVTCQYKCANACLGPECNSSHNETFQEVAAAALSRRALLGLGAAGALAIAVGGLRSKAPLSGPGSSGVGGAGAAFARPAGGSLPFDPIAPVNRLVDEFTVPSGYTWQPIIRWGDPLFSNAPAFAIDGQSPAAQALQFGYNSDYLDIVADPSGKTGVLVNNHEYVNPEIMFPPSSDPVEL